MFVLRKNLDVTILLNLIFDNLFSTRRLYPIFEESHTAAFVPGRFDVPAHTCYLGTIVHICTPLLAFPVWQKHFVRKMTFIRVKNLHNLDVGNVFVKWKYVQHVSWMLIKTCLVWRGVHHFCNSIKSIKLVTISQNQINPKSDTQSFRGRFQL